MKRSDFDSKVAWLGCVCYFGNSISDLEDLTRDWSDLVSQDLAQDPKFASGGPKPGPHPCGE